MSAKETGPKRKMGKKNARQRAARVNTEIGGQRAASALHLLLPAEFGTFFFF
jgi:hypothetical protein